jgi:hypothetical protein
MTYHFPTMINLLSLTSTQLKRAADLKDKISALEQELASILGSEPSAETSEGKTRKISAVGRARIAAAQKARWAKTKTQVASAQTTEDDEPKGGKKPKRKFSAAVRAKMAAAAKNRWAKAKAAGKSSR